MIFLSPRELEIVSEILKKHLPLVEVRAFGSRAHAKHKRFSDLDLALITDRPIFAADG